MICYKDMTFCSSINCKNKCGRKFTEEMREGAKLWWGGDDFPLALSEFCDIKGEVKK